MNRVEEYLAPDLQSIIPQMETESARQGHYYIGVEHLLMALTRIEDGFTASVFKELSLSPRFIRHSVRAAAGTGDSRRHWPGFRPTPRYLDVAARAQRHAGERGERYVGERDLLLAILDEGESVAVRVLIDLGVDLESLRAIAAGLQSVPPAAGSLLDIETEVELDNAYARVLSQMFGKYARLKVIRRFEGFSGATVLLVRPTKTDGRADANVVVKLDRARAIQYEKLRYDSYVKSTLPPITARITDPPVVLNSPDVGGLMYTFVGQQEATYTQSLYDYVHEHGPADLGRIIRNKIYAAFGWGWWEQRQPYSFVMWREYEHVLPPALVVQLEPGQDQPRGLRLDPHGKWSREGHIVAGDMVTLEHFTIYRAYPDRHELKLVAGTGPLAEDRANKIVVRGVTSDLATQGDRVDCLVGRLVQTRPDILRAYACAIFPTLDLNAPQLEPLTGLSVQNPLVVYPVLLNAMIRGTLSTVHGDLHLGNILIDPDERAWLIDFTWTRDGHTLFDWAVLEISILSAVIAPLVKGDVSAVLPALDVLNKQEALLTMPDHRLRQAFEALVTLREIVHRCLADGKAWEEYFAALTMCALRAICWDTLSNEVKALIFWAAALAVTEALEKLSTDTVYDDTMGFGESRFMDTTTEDQ